MNINQGHGTSRLRFLSGGGSPDRATDINEATQSNLQRNVSMTLLNTQITLPKEHVEQQTLASAPRYFQSLGQLHGLAVVAVGWVGFALIDSLARPSFLAYSGGIYCATMTAISCFYSSMAGIHVRPRALSLDSGYMRGAMVGGVQGAVPLFVAGGFWANCTALTAIVLFGAYALGRLSLAKRALRMGREIEPPRRGA
jgi:hypothetical protein